MAHHTINGWTRGRMLECITKYVPNNATGCMSDGRCVYINGTHRCAIGAFMSAADAEAMCESDGGVEDLPEHVLITLPLRVEDLNDLQALHDNVEGRRGATNARDACIAWIKQNVAFDPRSTIAQ